MPSVDVFFSYLQEKVHDFSMKPAYSEPKIYTGGVDTSRWSKLTNKQKTEAIAKSWYVYYSFRHPESGRMIRQKNIKGGANRFSTKSQRLKQLKKIQRHLLLLLEYGFSPYSDNNLLKAKLVRELHIDQPGDPAQVLPQDPTPTPSQPVNTAKEQKKESIFEEVYSIKKSIEFALELKRAATKANTFARYKSRIRRFENWLSQHVELSEPINKIDKRVISTYLNEELQRTSPRSRNNVRTDLSSLFQLLEDNDLIEKNFVHSIKKLPSKPVKNKSFTKTELERVLAYTQEHDPLLHLFVLFILYGFLRPIEICRLKVGDLHLTEKELHVDTKTKLNKIKRIPDILLDHLPSDLRSLPKNSYLFTPQGYGKSWATQEDHKRDYFSKRFKSIKEALEFGKEYGLYSFRHSGVKILYSQFVQEHGELAAKSKLMPITGHTDHKSLEAYLRDIDAFLPKDYSDFFKS